MQTKKYKVHDSFLVNCPNSCVDEVDNVEFWGTEYYSEDSAICLAAYHAGAILAEAGDLFVNIERGVI